MDYNTAKFTLQLDFMFVNKIYELKVKFYINGGLVMIKPYFLA